MIISNMNSGKLPFRIGCLASLAYIIVFFYFFPSSSDGFLYALLWIVGFFMLPVIISFMFGAGTIFGLIMSSFLNIFRIHKKKQPEEPQNYQQDNDNSTYINIDKYNTPEKKIDD